MDVYVYTIFQSIQVVYITRKTTDQARMHVATRGAYVYTCILYLSHTLRLSDLLVPSENMTIERG